MGLSSDPEARKRQLANLVPGQGKAGPGNQRGVVHGATSERALAPVRDRYLAEFRERYPGEPEALLTIAASRAARAELLSDYLDGVGIAKRSGQLRAAVDSLARAEAALERQLNQFERRAATSGAGDAASAAARLEAHLATYGSEEAA